MNIPFEVVHVIGSGLEKRMGDLEKYLETYEESLEEKEKRINRRIEVIQKTLDFCNENELLTYVEEYQETFNVLKDLFQVMLASAKKRGG